jgi:hypothetical protein
MQALATSIDESPLLFGFLPEPRLAGSVNKKYSFHGMGLIH